MCGRWQVPQHLPTLPRHFRAFDTKRAQALVPAGAETHLGALALCQNKGRDESRPGSLRGCAKLVAWQTDMVISGRALSPPGPVANRNTRVRLMVV